MSGSNVLGVTPTELVMVAVVLALIALVIVGRLRGRRPRR